MKSLEDGLMLGIIAFGMPAILVGFLSFVLNLFVALLAKPDLRAKITVGIPYLIAVACTAAYVLAFAADSPVKIPLWVEIIGPPVFPLPAAATIYLYYRADYRNRWVESADELPEGIELANDDWRVGLAVLALIAPFGAYRILFRAISFD